MAGALKVTTKVKLTGLGEEVVIEEEATMTVPVAYQQGYTVITTATTTAIQLFDMVDHILLTDIYGIYIKAEVDKIYVSLDTAGTGTITSTTAQLVYNVSEHDWLPINPGGNLGVVVDGDKVTSAFSWMIVGNAPA